MILAVAAAQQYAEEHMGRLLTPEEGEVFRASVLLALKQQSRRIVEGEDPVELRPVRRMTITERSHVEIGIKDGQGQSGAEIEESANRMLRSWATLIILAVVIAIAFAWA